MTNDDLLSLIIYNRVLQYAIDLEDWSNGVLKQLLSSIKKSHSDILNYLDSVGIGLSNWSESQSLALLDNFNELVVAPKSILNNYITEISTAVSENALMMHSDILSFGGRVKSFNKVTMSTSEFKSFIQNAIVGGKVLQEWVDSVYDYNINTEIGNDILTGIISGESYSDLVNGIEEGFKVAEKDAVAIGRTYIQGANIGIQEKIYEANQDIVNGVMWVSALENGGKKGKKSGGIVCVTCAWLHGQTWKLDEERPPCPLHHNCKCHLVAIMVPWKNLDIDNIDELETTYSSLAKETGGSYKDFLFQQPEKIQKSVLGPARFNLLKEGKIKWEDLVSKSTGQLALLHELL